MAEDGLEQSENGFKPRRPRLNTLRTPSSNPWKIVSTYNLHDEPMYLPIGQDGDMELETVELVDMSYSSGMPDIDKVLEDAKQLPIRQRRNTVRTIGSVAAERLRRVSTVRTIKPDNIITWEGADDPENPKNWPLKRKWIATGIVSLFTFMAPVASSMISPCLGDIARDLHVTDQFQQTLMLSIFILAFAVGPLLFGPLSEIYVCQ